MRVRIVHGEVLQVRFETIEEDPDYIEHTARFFLAQLNATFNVQVDPAVLVAPTQSKE
jgi:hypothetical protein